MAQAVTFFDTPINVTPSAVGAYRDVDVSAHVSNASGVLLHIYNTDVGHRNYGIRKKGSTDHNVNNIRARGHAYYAVGIDDNNVFEAWLQGISATWYVELLGYFDKDHVKFPDNGEFFADSTRDEWLTWDLSTFTGADTAIAGIFMYSNTESSDRRLGLRHPDSTEDRPMEVQQSSLAGAIVVGLNVDEKVEINRQRDGIITGCVGYFVSGVTVHATSIDVMPSTYGQWTDLPNTPAGIAGGFFEVGSTSAQQDCAFRPDGKTGFDGHYKQIMGKRMWAGSGAANDIVEGQFESSAFDCYLLVSVPVEAEAPTGSPMMHGANF